MQSNDAAMQGQGGAQPRQNQLLLKNKNQQGLLRKRLVHNGKSRVGWDRSIRNQVKTRTERLNRLKLIKHMLEHLKQRKVENV